jgi:hypothetical protein
LVAVLIYPLRLILFERAACRHMWSSYVMLRGFWCGLLSTGCCVARTAAAAQGLVWPVVVPLSTSSCHVTASCAAHAMLFVTHSGSVVLLQTALHVPTIVDAVTGGMPAPDHNSRCTYRMIRLAQHIACCTGTSCGRCSAPVIGKGHPQQLVQVEPDVLQVQDSAHGLPKQPLILLCAWLLQVCAVVTLSSTCGHWCRLGRVCLVLPVVEGQAARCAAEAGSTGLQKGWDRTRCPVDVLCMMLMYVDIFKRDISSGMITVTSCSRSLDCSRTWREPAPKASARTWPN